MSDEEDFTEDEEMDETEGSDSADSEQEPAATSVSFSESSSSRDRVRNQLNADIEAFLAKGGKIEEVPANVTADPPKKPESNYGSGPI